MKNSLLTDNPSTLIPFGLSYPGIGGGMYTGPATPATSSVGTTLAENRQQRTTMGGWCVVPDGTVYGERGSAIPFLGLADINYFARHPDGTVTALADDEVRLSASEYLGLDNEYDNVAVKVTPNTKRLLIALGLLDPADYDDRATGAQLTPSSGRGGNSVGNEGYEAIDNIGTGGLAAIGVSFASVAIVALVVAAIWFVPKDIAR